MRKFFSFHFVMTSALSLMLLAGLTTSCEKKDPKVEHPTNNTGNDNPGGGNNPGGGDNPGGGGVDGSQVCNQDSGEGIAVDGPLKLQFDEVTLPIGCRHGILATCYPHESSTQRWFWALGDGSDKSIVKTTVSYFETMAIGSTTVYRQLVELGEGGKITKVVASVPVKVNVVEPSTYKPNYPTLITKWNTSRKDIIQAVEKQGYKRTSGQYRNIMNLNNEYGYDSEIFFTNDPVFPYVIYKFVRSDESTDFKNGPKDSDILINAYMVSPSWELVNSFSQYPNILKGEGYVYKGKSALTNGGYSYFNDATKTFCSFTSLLVQAQPFCAVLKAYDPDGKMANALLPKK